MRIIFLITLLHLYLFSNELNLTLKEFTQLVSSQNKVNILISNDIEQDKLIFIVNDTFNTVDMFQFKDMLKTKDLLLITYKDFFYIEKNNKSFLDVEKQLSHNNYYIYIKYLSKDDLDVIFSHYELKYLFLRDKVVFSTTNDVYMRIKEVIKNYDIENERKECDYFLRTPYWVDGVEKVKVEYINNCPTDYEIWLSEKNNTKNKNNDNPIKDNNENINKNLSKLNESNNINTNIQKDFK